MNAWLERTCPRRATRSHHVDDGGLAAGAGTGAGQQGDPLGLLSRLAEQVTFVLIPPLVLIFLVLGTIFLGVATPTEGGAMGALGALIMAVAGAS
jgi:TRAP-type mannitol/chloroaromatic compound transport system permease large subunit